MKKINILIGFFFAVTAVSAQLPESKTLAHWRFEQIQRLDSTFSPTIVDGKSNTRSLAIKWGVYVLPFDSSLPLLNNIAILNYTYTNVCNYLY